MSESGCEYINDSSQYGFEFGLYFPPVQTNGKDPGERGVFDVPALDPSEVLAGENGGPDYFDEGNNPQHWSPLRLIFESDMAQFFKPGRVPHPVPLDPWATCPTCNGCNN